MISIIVAVAQNGVIGCENRLIWHIREDLQRFKRLTTGHPVVMGRKTFESLGRPLPKRTNVVITRQKGYAPQGVEVVHSLEEAIDRFPVSEEIFIIGGAQIYRQAMPRADRLYLTEVYHDYEGDVCFPAWNREEWKRVSEERYECGAEFAYPFAFLNYERKNRLNGDSCDLNDLNDVFSF